jgi:hypothetical protein
MGKIARVFPRRTNATPTDAYAFVGEPELEEPERLFRAAEYGTRNILRCYVLVGYPGDTFQGAEQRLRTVTRLGICPMAMLYKDKSGITTQEWRRFQRMWARLAVIYSPKNLMGTEMCAQEQQFSFAAYG